MKRHFNLRRLQTQIEAAKSERSWQKWAGRYNWGLVDCLMTEARKQIAAIKDLMGHQRLPAFCLVLRSSHSLYFAFSSSVRFWLEAQLNRNSKPAIKIAMSFFIFNLPNFRPPKLTPAGAGYGFGQNSMNFVQKTAGLHASRKQRPVVTVQAGALYKSADFKIELIVYFLGHWFHFI